MSSPLSQEWFKRRRIRNGVTPTIPLFDRRPVELQTMAFVIVPARMNTISQPIVCSPWSTASRHANGSCRDSLEWRSICILPPTPTLKTCLCTQAVRVVGPTLSSDASAILAPVCFQDRVRFGWISPYLRSQVSLPPSVPAFCSPRSTVGLTISSTVDLPIHMAAIAAAIVSLTLALGALVSLALCRFVSLWLPTLSGELIHPIGTSTNEHS